MQQPSQQLLQKLLVRKDYPLQATFGLDPAIVNPAIMVSGYDIPDPDTLSDPEERKHAAILRAAIPKVDAFHVHRREIISDIFEFWSDTRGDEVLLFFGGTGTGKTTGWDSFCGEIGIPCFVVGGAEDFESYKAFGQYTIVENGQTLFVPGPQTLASMYGVPCVYQEWDRIPSTRQVAFNDVFEGRPYPLPGQPGALLIPQPGARIVLTANTNLVEDETGGYGTARSSDMSLLDRISSINVDYPDSATERAILHRVLEDYDDQLLAYWFDQEGMRLSTEGGIKEGASISREEFINGAIDVAHKIRAESKDGGNESDAALERTMSTRMLRRWVHKSVRNSGAPERLGKSALHKALTKCMSNLATKSTRIALHAAVETVFGVGIDVK